MVSEGWTVDDALAQFAAAGKPLDPAGFRALVRHARRLGNLQKAGETTSGEMGGRGYIVFEIGQLQLMHKDLVRWLGLPSSGDTCPPSLDAGLLSPILALEPYARPLPGCGFAIRPDVHHPPDAGPDAYPEDTMCTKANGLEYYDACYCAGTGCGGHVRFAQLDIKWAPTGYHGPAQHTYTTACDGLHAPGPCPPGRQQPVWLSFGG